MHLDPAPVEPKPAKDKEVDWFAEHADDAASNEHAHAQVTRTRMRTPRHSLILLFQEHILMILNIVLLVVVKYYDEKWCSNCFQLLHESKFVSNYYFMFSAPMWCYYICQ